MVVTYVESTDDLEEFKQKISEKDIFLFCVSSLLNSHPSINLPSVLFVKILYSDEIFVIPFDHVDCDTSLNTYQVVDIINVFPNACYVFDKKSFCQIMDICDVIDINILSYVVNQEVIDVNVNVTTAHKFFNQRYSKCNILNKIIPVNKHLEKFTLLYEFTEDLLLKHGNILKLDSFLHLNYDITETLNHIESNGLHVDVEKFIESFGAQHSHLIDDSKVYSQYNLFTSTGRPSNAFGGVNYAALNKDDDTRLSFISRFGDKGKLVDIDFTAFHPHLIANLINYELELDTNIYEYLGQYYFNSKSITDDQLSKSKQLTFKQLYGGVESKYKNIPYFTKWITYVDQRYRFFKKNGYVETPIYGRKIHFSEDVNPSKLANYILQAYELEHNVGKIQRIIKLLSDTQSKLILYTYDSLLFDMHRDDINLMTKIKTIMQQGGFPISIKYGDNYKNMKKL